MRFTIPHNRGKAQAMTDVDRAIDEFFGALPGGFLSITDHQKSWKDSVMTFSFAGRVGLVRNLINGTVDVTEKDLTVDVDLGMLGRFFPQEKVRHGLETRIRGQIA
jgi:hypothetical protein